MNSVVVTEKKNGKMRVCLDPRDLNKAIKREHYPMKTVEEVAAELAGATVFSTLDASSGFWHVTPFGRYRFHRLPFGMVPIPRTAIRDGTDCSDCHSEWYRFLGLPFGMVPIPRTAILDGTDSSDCHSRWYRFLGLPFGMVPIPRTAFRDGTDSSDCLSG